MDDVHPGHAIAVGIHVVLGAVGLVLLWRAWRRRSAGEGARGGLPAPPRWTALDVAIIGVPYLLLGIAGLFADVSERALEPSDFVVGAAPALMLALGVFYLISRHGQPPGEALGLAPRGGVGRAAAIGLRYWVMAYPLIYGVLLLANGIANALGIEPRINLAAEIFLSTDSIAMLVTIAVFAVVIAPLTEELLFRGFFYGYARARLGRAAAIAVVSAAFAAVHPPIDWPSILALAIALVLAYERARSIVAPIIAHVANNALSIALLTLARWAGDLPAAL